MRDGRTRRVESSASDAAAFLESNRASLTVLRGPAEGSEVELVSKRMMIGRSVGAGLQLEDPSVSHEHAAIELTERGFSVRDLGSTNGVSVNGGAVQSTDLKHGDRISIGECEIQYVLEERRGGAGKAWSLDEL